MAFTLVDAKTELGITGTAQDVSIQRILDISLRLVEKYLDRLLEYKREQVRFFEIKSQKIWVPRYPIETVHSVDNKTFVTTDKKWEVHYHNGWIKGPFNHEIVTVDYTGGYNPIPDALLWAMWQVFHHLWDQDQNRGTGAVQTGAIDSITIPDVGTVRFNTSGSQRSSVPGSSEFAGLPVDAIAVLNLYRRESC